MSQAIPALMLDLEGPELQADEKLLLQESRVGGLILFARNCVDREQVCALVDSVRAVRPELLIAVDQEGGRVQRLRDGFTRLPPAGALGQLIRRDTTRALALARDTGWLMATELLECGIDFSFAPVLDLNTGISEVIGDRAFSDDPEQLLPLALAYVDGMHEAGMAAVGKHFPGHGSVAADSHVAVPVDERSLDEIRAKDLAIFRDCLPILDAIMPAHVIYPALDTMPAGFSHRWLGEMLRGELGFRGLIFSDDLCMAGAAQVGDMPERVSAAVSAGCEVLLVCNDRAAALEALECLRDAPPREPGRLARMQRRPAEYPAASTSLQARKLAVRKALSDLSQRGERE